MFWLFVVVIDLDCLFKFGWVVIFTFRVGCISFGALGLWVCGSVGFLSFAFGSCDCGWSDF